MNLFLLCLFIICLLVINSLSTTFKFKNATQPENLDIEFSKAGLMVFLIKIIFLNKKYYLSSKKYNRLLLLLNGYKVISQNIYNYYTNFPQDKIIELQISNFKAAFTAIKFFSDIILYYISALFFLIIYFTILFFLFCVSIVYSLVHLKYIVNQQNKMYYDPIFDQYLNELLPVHKKNWKDIGSFVFKLNEGLYFQKFLQNDRSERIVEFGIYDGVISSLHLEKLKVIEFGCEVVENISLIKNHKYKNIVTGQNAFAENFANIHSGSFNKVIMIHIVDHIQNIEKAIENINSILDKEGVFIFSGISDEFQGYYMNELSTQKQLLNNFTYDEWNQLLLKKGFEIIKYQKFLKGISALTWKFLLFLNYRTHYKSIFYKLYQKIYFFRIIVRLITKSILQYSFIIDNEKKSLQNKGLHFICIARKIDHAKK